MHYPYLLYSKQVNHQPVFPELEGDPFIMDLSDNSSLLDGIDVRDQQNLQQILDAKMGSKFRWGLSAYLERRGSLLADCPQMVTEKRFIHLGLDVIVAAGTPLHAPLDAVVEDCGYESGDGNYGAYVLLKHASRSFETFYSFYGHLARERLPGAGQRVPAGHVFAEVGDFHENGNWFYHTHIQVITRRGLDAGYAFKGYCSREDMVTINDLCPSPIPLFTLPHNPI